jgi:transcription antitermination factor NusG
LIEPQTEAESKNLVEHDAPWFALHVRSRSEKMVSASLRSKGYEEFLPLYRSRNHWSDRVKDVDLPLFPGYVFCRLDPSRRLPVLTTPGVVAIIGSGKIAQPVEPEELAAIQSLVKSGLPAVPWPFLKAGEHVRIEHGALEGFEGILTAVKKEFRVVLSVTLLQRSVAVEIDRSFIRPILPRSAVNVRDQTKDQNYQHSTVR